MGCHLLVTLRLADPLVCVGTSSAPVIFGSRSCQQSMLMIHNMLSLQTDVNDHTGNMAIDSEMIPSQICPNYKKKAQNDTLLNSNST